MTTLYIRPTSFLWRSIFSSSLYNPHKRFTQVGPSRSIRNDSTSTKNSEPKNDAKEPTLDNKFVPTLVAQDEDCCLMFSIIESTCGRKLFLSIKSLTPRHCELAWSIILGMLSTNLADCWTIGGITNQITQPKSRTSVVYASAVPPNRLFPGSFLAIAATGRFSANAKNREIPNKTSASFAE